MTWNPDILPMWYGDICDVTHVSASAQTTGPMQRPVGNSSVPSINHFTLELLSTYIHVLSDSEDTYTSKDVPNYQRIENAEGYVLIAVYLFICMRVTRITQKVLNRIAWNLVRW